MSTLMGEKYGNIIKTKGNTSVNSKLKKYIEHTSSENIFTLNKLINIQSNLFFKEKETDILNCLPNTTEYIDILQKHGYKETTYKRFDHEDYNVVKEVEKIKYVNNLTNNFVSEISIRTQDGRYDDFVHFLSRNYILFASFSYSKAEFYYNFPTEYNILDFKITKENFIYLLYEFENEKFLVKTHLGLKFCLLNEDVKPTVFEEFFISKIKLECDVNKILLNDLNEWYLWNSVSKEIFKITLGKRYYFIDVDKLYFNLIEQIEERYRFYFLDKQDTQLEFLNMYNYINFLGLNDFKIDDVRKISSKENDVFLNIFKTKFDNTLNGGLNFFNSKRYNFDDNIEEVFSQVNKIHKDYVINIDDENFQILGNFNNNFRKGEYKLVFTYDTLESNYITANLHRKNKDTYYSEKKIKFYLNKNRTFYFCNLKIVFKKTDFVKFDFSYFISANDIYTFITKNNTNYKIEKLPNSPTVKNYLKNDSKILGSFIENKFVYYVNGSIIFENYFNFKESRYKYHDEKITLDNLLNDYFDIRDDFIYTVIGSHFIKNNRIYPKTKCTVHFSYTKFKSINLIDDLGYITDFWKNNSDRVVFVREENDKISIVEKIEDSDWSIYIPDILGRVIEDDLLSNVEIAYNDEFEVTTKITPGKMMTSKFFNKPLFYKVFIEDCTEINIFRDDGVLVNESIVENYSNGKIVYFNKEYDRKYYANTNNEKFLYLNPIYAHENIETIYSFANNKEYNFELKKIYNIKVTVDKPIASDDIFRVLLYNSVDSSVTSIELKKEDLDTSFSINKNVNKIVLELVSKNLGYENVFIHDISNNSNVVDHTLVFNKNNVNEPVYITQENCIIENSDIDIKQKLKVNTEYEIKKGNLKSKYMIMLPFDHDIFINENENLEGLTSKVFTTYSYGEDIFFEENFKSPGSFYNSNKIEFIKTLEVINNEFDSTDIIN